MQYSQEHLKTMVYAIFFLGGGGGKQCIMGYSKIENREKEIPSFLSYLKVIGIAQSRELPLCGQVLYRLSTHGFLQL